MGRIASVDDDKFSNWSEECTKVVYMPNTNRYYVPVIVKCVKELVPWKIWSVLDFYAAWIAAAEI